MSELCEGRIINDVFIQFNGIIRDSSGKFLARLDGDIDYKSIDAGNTRHNEQLRNELIKAVKEVRINMEYVNEDCNQGYNDACNDILQAIDKALAKHKG